MSLFKFLRGTRENSFSIGDGVDSDKKVEAAIPGANKPALRFNHTTAKWEYSNNGSDYSEMGSGGSATLSKSFMITNPTAAADGPVWRVPVAITITHIHVLCIGGTSITGQLWEYDANGANGATIDSADIVATAGTNANDDGTISNPSIDAGDYLGWKTTSISGTPAGVFVSFEYEED